MDVVGGSTDKDVRSVRRGRVGQGGQPRPLRPKVRQALSLQLSTCHLAVWPCGAQQGLRCLAHARQPWGQPQRVGSPHGGAQLESLIHPTEH